MAEQASNDLQEIVHTLSETWKGIMITIGVKSGIFSRLNHNLPQSLDDLATLTGYDRMKLARWLYFTSKFGLTRQHEDGYLLTPKSALFLEGSPFKDIQGFVKLTDFFQDAAVNCNETLKPGGSLDKLTEGKITRNYQPNVSDNLSMVLFDIFTQYKMKEGDSLLDIGAGMGNFVRAIAARIPGLQISGFDSNLFAIDTAKSENKRLGLSDRVKMVVGDARTDLVEYKNRSIDWVTLINVFHFYPIKDRLALVDQMIRIARKGVFMTEIVIENPLSAGANPLMSLLWEDFTGFFTQEEADELNRAIVRKHPHHQLTKIPILQNTSHLVVITPKNSDEKDVTP